MWGPYPGGVCFDESPILDYLTEGEIKSAISGKNINLLGIDSCLMASTEFMYSLREETDVLVGSEDLACGLPYYKTLEWLINNPTATSTQLGTNIVKDYIDPYSSDCFLTLSAIDSSELDDLLIAINNFADALSAGLPTLKNPLTAIRTSLYECGDCPFVDLWTLANESTAIPVVATEANALKTAIETAVILSEHGPSKDQSNGLSIYFPSTPSDYSSLYRSNDFSTDSTWDSFLLNYFSFGYMEP